MRENYTKNSAENKTILFDINYIVSTIENYFNKTSLKYSKSTGWWYLKGSHNSKTEEIFGYSKAKHISFLYKKVWEKLGWEIEKTHYSHLLEIKDKIQVTKTEYEPMKIGEISETLSEIFNIRFDEHKQIAGKQFSLAQELDRLNRHKTFSEFYKSLNIKKPFSSETEMYLKEIFTVNRFGDPALNMRNSIFSIIPEKFCTIGDVVNSPKFRKEVLRVERKLFKERKIFFHTDGTPVKKLPPLRESSPLYYHIPRFLRDSYGNIIINQKKQSPIKYPKLKAPNQFFKTPTFVAYSDEERKKVEHIFLVEGMKDFATMIDIVLEKNIENFAIVLILGVAEFPKIAIKFGRKFLKAKIHLMADDDLAGEEAINITYRKMPSHIRRRTDYIDWKNIISKKMRTPKNDITDYREMGYKFEMEHLSNLFQLSKKDIEKINQEKSRSFFKLSPDKNIKNLTEYLESEKGKFLKNSLLNGEKRLILQSPMGSGKSYILKDWLPNEIKKLQRKEINIVFSPLKSLRNELLQTGKYQNGEAFLYGGNYQKQQFFAITTQFLTAKIKKEVFQQRVQEFQKQGFKINIWIDEAHIHSEITKNLRFIYQLEEKLNIRLILLSATAKLLFVRDWRKKEVQKFDIQLPKLKFSSFQTLFCKNSSDLTPTTIQQVKNLSGKVVIMINSDIESILIKNELLKSGRNPQIINALNKYQLDFHKFDTFLVTSITEFGLNFFGSKIDYIVGVNLSPFSLIQFIGRFRDRENAKIINIQKEKTSNIDKMKILVLEKEKSSFEYQNNQIILNLEKKVFQEILKNRSNKNGKLSTFIKKYIPDLQFSIETMDKQKKGQFSVYIDLKGSKLSPALEYFNLDNRGDDFDDILILEDKIKADLNSFLFDSIISEYIEVPKSTYIFMKKEKILKKKTFENRKELKESFVKQALSETTTKENGVSKAQKIRENISEKFDSEIFYRNYFHNSSTLKIYQKIIFAKTVLYFQEKYGKKKFLFEVKTIINQIQISSWEGKKVSRNLIPLMAMIGNPLSHYKKEARYKSGLMTFAKNQRKYITEISKYLKYLENNEFEKFGLQEFDKNILENEIIKKYISGSSLFQSLEKIFENLKVS